MKACTKPRMHMRGLALLLFLLGARSSLCAQVTLPLQGYYRPDHFMPVHASGPATFTGEGIFPTTVNDSHPSTIPVLIHGRPRELNQTGGSPALPLRPVREDERLVASTSFMPAFASDLFPDKKTIGIRLSDNDPLPGPVVAWEMLDAIILNAQEMALLGTDRQGALLGAGVLLAVTDGAAPPDTVWPWKRQGPLWLLRHTPLGPGSALVNERVYTPANAWKPEWAPAMRAQVLGGGVLLGIAAVALTLWRSRATVLAIVLLSFVTCLAAVAWRGARGTVHIAGGDVVVNVDALVQRDTWVYERARANGVRRVRWDGLTRPVFASGTQLAEASLRLVVEDDGTLSFEYHARRGQTVAFMHRQVRPKAEAEQPARHATLPMNDLVNAMYRGTE